MPNLKRPAYWVMLAPEGTDPDTLTDDQAETHHVVVHSADQLRAELEAAKLGLKGGGRDAPMHLTALWLWAALVRTGRFSEGFQVFKARCLAYDPDQDRDAPHTTDPDTPDDLDAHPTGASTS